MSNSDAPRSVVKGPTIEFEWFGRTVKALRPTTMAWNKAAPLVYDWGEYYQEIEQKGEEAQQRAATESIDEALLVPTFDILRDHILEGTPHGVEYIPHFNIGTLLVQWYHACATTESEQKKSEPPSQ